MTRREQTRRFYAKLAANLPEGLPDGSVIVISKGVPTLIVNDDGRPTTLVELIEGVATSTVEELS